MKRYEHIDISKGIGILLVVFFHLPGVNRLIYFNNWEGWITTFYRGCKLNCVSKE